LLSGALVVSAVAALFAKKVSSSLIALFYTSIALGVAFTFYGDALLGLLTMITFAGAISVLMLTVILMTGESKLNIGAKSLGTLALSLVTALGVVSLYLLYPAQAGSISSTDSSLNVISFAWALRPWDLLILVTVFTAAVISITNLVGEEE
jgi:NADH:ubiquinone oxidoreductase subunit 6 (subunit J)